MPPSFRMVVLGDSILWGQGLLPAEKFSTKIQQWLSLELGRTVTLEVLAHSRAVIIPDDLKDAIPAKPGEVPNKHPSITAQAKQVLSAESVNLLILDGGINDMGAQKILSPLHLFDLDWIKSQAALYCGEMEKLLQLTILPRFAQATVVVTGYYPLVSEQSDPLRVEKLISLICPELAGAATMAIENLLTPLARQCRAWVEASNATLSAAVDAVNKSVNARFPNFVFAPVAFGPAHCYAAPATLLWSLEEEDSVAPERRKLCREFDPLDPLCPCEAAFHPNQAGAAVYAEAIRQKLGPFVSGWK
jgi:lysophospholipase L1-like esterase